MWDLSGKKSLQKLWEKYYDELDALIFIIDISNSNINNSIYTLSKKNILILKSTAPILILLNKIDLVDDEKEKNKLDNIYKNIDYSLLSEKHFLVKEISALKNKNLEESIRWLFNSMTDQEKTK